MPQLFLQNDTFLLLIQNTNSPLLTHINTVNYHYQSQLCKEFILLFQDLLSMIMQVQKKNALELCISCRTSSSQIDNPNLII